MQAMVTLAPEHTFLCFGDRRAFDAFPLDAPNVECIEVALDASPTLAAAADGARSVPDMLRLTRAVRTAAPDVFFSPSVYTYFPLPLGMRAVVTIHDAIAERFPHLTLPSARARLFWKLKVKLAIAQADVVLTVSEYSRRDLQRVLGISPQRLRVAVEAPAEAYHPVPIAESRAAARDVGVPDGAGWFTYVGGFNPHKRIDLIIRAHAAIAKGAVVPPHLLLVGTTTGDVFHGESGRLRHLIDECGTTALVHWTGFVPDERLRQLHAGRSPPSSRRSAKGSASRQWRRPRAERRSSRPPKARSPSCWPVAGSSWCRATFPPSPTRCAASRTTPRCARR